MGFCPDHQNTNSLYSIRKARSWNGYDLVQAEIKKKCGVLVFLAPLTRCFMQVDVEFMMTQSLGEVRRAVICSGSFREAYEKEYRQPRFLPTPGFPFSWEARDRFLNVGGGMSPTHLFWEYIWACSQSTRVKGMVPKCWSHVQMPSQQHSDWCLTKYLSTMAWLI